MKKINFCKATTIILIINVILSIVLFFVVPDNIAIQWVGTTPRYECKSNNHRKPVNSHVPL